MADAYNHLRKCIRLIIGRLTAETDKETPSPIRHLVKVPHAEVSNDNAYLFKSTSFAQQTVIGFEGIRKYRNVGQHRTSWRKLKTGLWL